jgi:4-hydroxy-tetrahydrodipicolinate reductase
LENIKVVIYGIGVIGRRLAKHLITKEGVEIVGAIDINPEIVGADLGDIIEEGEMGVVICKDAEKVLHEKKPDIVCHTTSSYLRQTFSQLEQILKNGVNIVSTCEELSYPYATKSGNDFADRLDNIAKENCATLLGTGVNPGYLMDTLPIFLTAVCEEVEQVTIVRQMNAATRRVPFQKKIGAGLTLNEFRESIEKGTITGHVGLEQSISMISKALGWELDSIHVDPVESVTLDYDVASTAIDVPQGSTAGSKQMAYGIMDGKPVITTDFRAYIGAQEEFDSVHVKGVPPINQKITPCVHGDHATIAITANMIPHVLNSEPGLKTMIDLPIPHATMSHLRKYVKA